MDKFKTFVRSNKKLVAAIIVALVGLAGVTLAPETADKITDSIVQICCAAPEVGAPE